MTRQLSDVLKAASARPYRVDGFSIRTSTNRRIAAEPGDALLLAHAANQIEGLVEAVTAQELRLRSINHHDLQAELADIRKELRAALAKATTIDL